MKINETALKKSIAAVTKENPEKRLAQGKRYLQEALDARAEKKKRADSEACAMTKDAVRFMCKSARKDIFVMNAGFGERKPLYCDKCKERVTSVTISVKGSMCRKCTQEQQGKKSTVLVMPKYIKVRKAS